MPFTRLQEAATLAASIDTAMNRRDEVGMDMLRDLLPELREIIDDINAGLQEVDELLFAGLRDEAVALHDPDFARLAARLNLEDKSAWPEAQAWFEREGITPPPRIDFETLAALESAHAELEELGRPLDKLRRLVLQRSPLAARLDLLRKLRDADGTKPVWAQTIADHERARLAEIPEAVKRALAAREPAAIADLHVELVDPEWSVAVPKDLVKATRGADLWTRLRESVTAAEASAAALEAGMQAGECDPHAVAALRQARQAWYHAAGGSEECRSGLADCPTVAALAAAEGIDARFQGLAERVRPALEMLEMLDAEEAAVAAAAQARAQLESFLAHLPQSARHEPQWLAGVTSLEQHLAARGGLPADLQARVTRAVANVRGRPNRRLALRGGIGLAAITAVIVGLSWIRGCVQRQGAFAAVIDRLEDELSAARAGAYEVVPDTVRTASVGYEQDDTVRDLLQAIEAAVNGESQRRRAVEASLAEHARLLEAVGRELVARQDGGDALAPWPATIVEAANAWRQARKAGGTKEGLPGGNAPAAARRSDEEGRIVAARERQETVEKRLQSAAVKQFMARRGEIEAMLATNATAPKREVCAEARRQLEDLKAAAQAAKVPDATLLLASTSQSVVPPDRQGELASLQAMLTLQERVIARTAPRPVKPAPDGEEAP